MNDFKRWIINSLYVLSGLSLILLFIFSLILLTKDKITILEVTKINNEYEVIYQKKSFGNVWTTSETFQTRDGAIYFIHLNEKEYRGEIK